MVSLEVEDSNSLASNWDSSVCCVAAMMTLAGSCSQKA